MQTYGFVQIVGHNVDTHLMMKAFDCSSLFFNAPYSYKLSKISKDPARRGYSPSLTENFATLVGQSGKPNDVVEKYRIGAPISQIMSANPSYYGTKEGRIHFFPNNINELTEIDTFESTMKEYYQAMESLSTQLLHLIALSTGVPTNIFPKLFDKHTSILSLNNYATAGAIRDGDDFIRVAEHTDVSMFTIVAQVSTNEEAGGLEVYDHISGVYVPVAYIPGALVVNIGDCLHDWSGGAFRSSLHRVVIRPMASENSGLEDGQLAEKDLRADADSAVVTSSSAKNSTNSTRISLAYFCTPNYDAILRWPTPDVETHTADINTSPGTSSTPDYSTWRKYRVKSALQKLKKNTSKYKA